MHNFILIIKVLGEATRRHVFYLTFKHLRDWIAHLLENVEEEHELVFSLFTVGHVLVELINSGLQLFVLLENFSTLV